TRFSRDWSSDVCSSDLAAIVAGPGTGSIMTRRLLAFAVIVPLLLGWINLQLERAGYIDAPFATAALMLAIIAILTGLIVRTALRSEERRGGKECGVGR